MKKTMIIAEAGVNHNGDFEIAKKMIDVAKECGADVIKFQTAQVDSLVSKNASMAKYQKENIGKETSQKEMLEKLLLNYEEFETLFQYCKEIGIRFLSTPFDVKSIDFLDSLGCSIWKIPSGEITNWPYLVKIAKTNKPVILSTGMSSMQEVRDCVALLKKNGTTDITLLHCTTQYPTNYEDVNLNAMLTLGKEFGFEFGYSDHTNGIEVAIAAVAMGAKIIEKHFTLDKNMEGPDHKASLEPLELKQMIESIRNVESAFGSGEKKAVESELENIVVARKSIIAARDIKKGEIFTEENITTKRPGNGINPMRWNEVIGKRAIRCFEEDELIEI